MTTTLSRRSFLRAAGVSLALPTLGIHAGKFASSTGTMRGLELA